MEMSPCGNTFFEPNDLPASLDITWHHFLPLSHSHLGPWGLQGSAGMWLATQRRSTFMLLDLEIYLLNAHLFQSILSLDEERLL